MIIAGEASGDMHAADLVKAIKTLDPNITFSGLGGPKMHNAGVELYEDLTKIAVVGFAEVIKHFQDFLSIFDAFLKRVDELNPSAVILVDYPGFNLRMAKELKKRNIKVIYYISPQLWAWKENRIKSIKECIDKMLVLFAFEKEFYAKRGVDVEFVGHPLIDQIKVEIPREQLLESLDFDKNYPVIGILPGSRRKEVEKLLPPMLEAAKILHEGNPNLQFLIMKAPTIRINFLKDYSGIHSLPLHIIPDRTYDGINACDLCMVASGTATLETAILNKPMVVVYKTSLPTYWLAKSFVKIPNIGLVNVVANKQIVPECIQNNAKGNKIAEELEEILKDNNKSASIKEELLKVKSTLGAPGASQRAAEKVLEEINTTRI